MNIPAKIDGKKVVKIGGYDGGSFVKGAFEGCTANITYKGKTYTSDNYGDLYKAINSN